MTTNSAGSQDRQLCNTAVTGKNSDCTRYSIDWLRYSFPLTNIQWDVHTKTEEFDDHDRFTGEVYRNRRHVEPFIHGSQAPLGFIEPHHAIFEYTSESVRPFAYYNAARKMGAGTVNWHTENQKQGGLVELSGQDCTAIHSAGVDFLVVISHAIYGLNGSVTRLDFAVDIFAPVDPQDIETAWKEQRVHTPAQKAHPWPEYGADGQMTGYTFYIGAPSSERKVRVYDKAASEGVPGPWVRIELEAKGKHALALAKTMLVNGIIPGGKAYLREFIQVDECEWFNAALSGDGGEWIEPMERKLTDKQRWYAQQVLPAIHADLVRGDTWLRNELESILDDTAEAAQHGPFVPPKPLENSPKAFKGVQILVGLGFDGPYFRRAFEDKGKDFIVTLLSQFGYGWDTKGQKWMKCG